MSYPSVESQGSQQSGLGACKSSTIRTRRNDLVSLAKKAVNYRLKSTNHGMTC
jgi:hypothetical protein